VHYKQGGLSQTLAIIPLGVPATPTRLYHGSVVQALGWLSTSTIYVRLFVPTLPEP
jgi:hypothetical protein